MNKSQYSEILERITDAFVALDKNWCYTYMNKKAGEIFNRNPQEMPGKHIWTEFPEGIDQPFYKAYYKAMAEQQYIYLEEYYPPLDNWFENHIYPSPEGLSIYFRNITEKKNAEIKLNNSLTELSNYRAALNESSFVSITDSKGIITYVSESFCKITQYSAEELTGKSHRIFNPGYHPKEFFKELWTTIKKGDIWKGEIKDKIKNGTFVWFNTTIIPFLDEERNPLKFVAVRTDITEKKKTEIALKEKGNFIESIINSSPDIIYIYDIEEQKNFYVNDGIQTNLGYSDAEIKEMGKSVLPLLMHPDDFQFYLHNTFPKYALAKDKEIIFQEFRMQDKHGNWHLFSCKESVFHRTEKGEAKQIFGMAADITERRIAEEKLIKSKELFSGAFHTSPAGIIITRISDGKIIDANESFLTMFEFRREETIGHTSVELNMVSQKDRAKLKQQQFPSDGLINFELLSQTKSGKPINILFSSKQLIINDGPCHITTIIDITERKKVEMELRGEKDRFEKIVNTVPGVICSFKLSPDGSTNYPYSSPGMVEMFGIKPEELIEDSAPMMQKIHPDDIEKTQKAIFASAQNMSEFRMEYRFEHPQKGWIWIEVVSLPFANPDGSIVWTGFVSDSTERKKAEIEILTMNKTLRELSSHLQTFREEERKNIAREIHDELGQQLAALKIDAKWIYKKIENDVMVKNKMEGMLVMIDDTVKTVRKISSELRPEMLDELGLAVALDWKVKKFFERSGIKCNLQNESGELNLSSETAINIFRIVQESFTNISKHSEATEVKLHLKMENGNLIVSIIDNGKGFDLEKIKLKKTFGIIGIRERAKMIGGNIQFISQEGKGTEVKLILPIV